MTYNIHGFINSNKFKIYRTMFKTLRSIKSKNETLISSSLTHGTRRNSRSWFL